MWPFKKSNPLNSVQPQYYYPVEFDIENEDVFSVERVQEKTVIGFYSKKDQEITEWNFICSPEQHKDFIDRFKNKLNLVKENKVQD